MNELDAMHRYRQLLRQDVPVPPLDVVAQVVASLDLNAEQITSDIATVQTYADAWSLAAGLDDAEWELDSARKVLGALERQFAVRILLDRAKDRGGLDQGLDGQVTVAGNRVAVLETKAAEAREAGKTRAGILSDSPELVG